MAAHPADLFGCHMILFYKHRRLFKRRGSWRNSLRSARSCPALRNCVSTLQIGVPALCFPIWMIQPRVYGLLCRKQLRFRPLVRYSHLCPRRGLPPNSVHSLLNGLRLLPRICKSCHPRRPYITRHQLRTVSSLGPRTTSKVGLRVLT
jgi:hypothetical protein